jgi:gamma-glutamyl:cysteine ligase YbdK (ATP-grasp superfamily)
VRRGRAKRYRLFEVVGIELEYVIVDRKLRPLCLLDEAFRYVHGRPTSELQYKRVGFSNELAAHVFEIKTLDPRRSLVQIEADLLEGLRFFASVLRDRFDARLLPTGMHPFMRPSETELWKRANRAIYATYASIFPIRDHGWLNLQANHINLPFGSEADTVVMHNALACLLPYLPALAASSPIYEGAIGPAVDNRMEFYKANQRRFPSITGLVVPEYIDSFRDYRRKVFKPIRDSLAGIPGAERLHPEWVNSRGAIMRFSRRALEIKALDVQECVRSDIAIAAFTRGALRGLWRALKTDGLLLPEHSTLVDDLNATIREGSRGSVYGRHLRGNGVGGRGRTTARRILEKLLDLAKAEMADEERRYLGIVEDRIRRGSLSERIAHQVRRRAKRGDVASAIRAVYNELAECLDENVPWSG